MDASDKKTVPPILYLPHGGGPLPILGDPEHASLTHFLKTIGSELGNPKAILLISAHWEEDIPTITSGQSPDLIYDYYGFPEASYQIKYPAPGSPQLAKSVSESLLANGIESQLDNKRGFDHGMFVPMKLMFPTANIPCVQISLAHHLNPETHINIGKALADLREENVLIIGSGLSFHNMTAFFSSTDPFLSKAFDQWLVDTCCDQNMTPKRQQERLINWALAPHARYCHPREEHLLPLHVCFGAATKGSPLAKTVYHETLMGNTVSGFLWE